MRNRRIRRGSRRRQYNRDSTCAVPAVEQEAQRGAANRGGAESKRRYTATSVPALPEATAGDTVEQAERHRSDQTVARGCVGPVISIAAGPLV